VILIALYRPILSRAVLYRGRFDPIRNLSATFRDGTCKSYIFGLFRCIFRHCTWNESGLQVNFVDFIAINKHVNNRQIQERNYVPSGPQRPQTRNCATATSSAVSQTLVNCRNKLYDKYTTNWTELEGYSWPSCRKQPRLVHRCRQQTRPTTTTTSC